MDARVDDAFKQHLQKMDWLHGDAVTQAATLTPPPAGATASGGKMGFNLPLSEAPEAQEVIAPVLEVKMTPEGVNERSAEGNSGQDCEDAAKAAATAAESLAEPAAPPTDGKIEKEAKTGSSPPKDGTPV